MRTAVVEPIVVCPARPARQQIRQPRWRRPVLPAAEVDHPCPPSGPAYAGRLDARCAASPRVLTPSNRDSSAASLTSPGSTARHIALHEDRTDEPALDRWRAHGAVARLPSRRRRVIDPHGATSAESCSTKVFRGHCSSPHSQTRRRHTIRTRLVPSTSCNSQRRRPLPRRTTGTRRRGRARDRHRQHASRRSTLYMDTVGTEQQVTTGTRAEGRAQVSAPRSRGNHVEVPGVDQEISAQTLEDLDPYPPTMTRRSSPPPNVRKAIKCRPRKPTRLRPGIPQTSQTGPIATRGLRLPTTSAPWIAMSRFQWSGGRSA